MPLNKKTPWLLCYDIADERRLYRVHRTISRFSIPFQYSVYYTFGTKNQIQRIIEDVEKLIDKNQDDVRAYPLSSTAQTYVFGSSLLPEGISYLHNQEPLFNINETKYREN